MLSQQRPRCFDHDESISRIIDALSFPTPFSLFSGTGAGMRPNNLLSDMKLDLKDAHDAVQVSVDLPGIRKEDVQVSITPDRILSISAERKSDEEHVDDAAKSVYVERTFGRLNRSIRLPRTVDTDQATCQFSNGVLEIRVAKKDPQAERKYLTVG